ncbi:hypothetical protein BEP19_12215 [Ammoniphilus oxalaticus]|uniref:DUF1002 domain-containing protein n=1 Tax=Ammoniphilus oxalaticus TaxID=66863 RepID=A0A419SGT0_9BACL|nr:DUF1002 domain-containing protein [Ammoniphilus oxalaticus]RKD22989.1 hypothetical protein BEP19_12215 [Ammoniphilus oxalaticus]
MKNRLLALLLSVCLLSVPLTAFADSAPGDVIITLGENLNEQQKTALLSEMGNPEEPLIVYVTNQEEHKYLGEYISKAQIGTRAISSSRIIIGEKDSELSVTTHNITWVSDDMYMNAMSTAGVKDAEVYVTAPFAVSGTAALTGILKAYETTMNIKIPEEQKQVANEEMVKTAKLSESIGDDKAVQFMNEVKQEIAKNPPKTTEDIRALIQRVAEQLGIQLTGDELNGLVSLFDKMRNLNIDWQQVGKNLEIAKGKFDEIMQQEETKNFLSAFGAFFKKLISIINGWFN